MTDASAMRALTHLLGCIRGDWDERGIVAAIRKAHGDGYPLADIAAAATDAARTPSTATPGGINSRLRDGWANRAPFDHPTPTPPNVTGLWRDLPPPEDRVAGPSDEQRAMIAEALRGVR